MIEIHSKGILDILQMFLRVSTFNSLLQAHTKVRVFISTIFKAVIFWAYNILRLTSLQTCLLQIHLRQQPQSRQYTAQWCKSNGNITAQQRYLSPPLVEVNQAQGTGSNIIPPLLARGSDLQLHITRGALTNWAQDHRWISSKLCLGKLIFIYFFLDVRFCWVMKL